MMVEARGDDDRSLVARARGRVYALLAAAFDYPAAGFFAAVESGTFGSELIDLVVALYPELEERIAGEALTLCAARSLSAQQSDYLASFETGVPKSPVQLYEGLCGPAGERATLLLELKAFFRQFGLKMNGAQREFEDHLTAELEFMQFLAAKEADALEGGRDCQPYRHAQRDFLLRHLGRWLPRLAQGAKRLQSAFYRSLADIAAMFVERDQEAILGHWRGEATLG